MVQRTIQRNPQRIGRISHLIVIIIIVIVIVIIIVINFAIAVSFIAQFAVDQV